MPPQCLCRPCQAQSPGKPHSHAVYPNPIPHAAPLPMPPMPIAFLTLAHTPTPPTPTPLPKLPADLRSKRWATCRRRQPGSQCGRLWQANKQSEALVTVAQGPDAPRPCGHVHAPLIAQARTTGIAGPALGSSGKPPVAAPTHGMEGARPPHDNSTTSASQHSRSSAAHCAQLLCPAVSGALTPHVEQRHLHIKVDGGVGLAVGEEERKLAALVVLHSGRGTGTPTAVRGVQDASSCTGNTLEARARRLPGQRGCCRSVHQCSTASKHSRQRSSRQDEQQRSPQSAR